MKAFFILLILLLLALYTWSQQVSDQKSSGLFPGPLSVQVLVGSQGIGADAKYGFLPYLSGRFGFGIIPVNVNSVFGFSSFSTDNSLSAKFSNLHLLADYSPFGGSSFRVVGGAGYFFRGDANVLIAPTGSYQMGNTTVTKDQLGDIDASADWNGFAPYLGIGLFRSFPGSLFNMNLDLGAYYLASPQTSLTGTKMLAGNSSQEPQFNQNMQSYRWMPVLQLNFNFRIK